MKAVTAINLNWTFLLGFLIYEIIIFIPILGGIVAFVATVLGIGALLIGKFSLFKNLRNKQLI